MTQEINDKIKDQMIINDLAISARVISCFAAILVLVQIYLFGNNERSVPLIKIAAFLFFASAVLEMAVIGKGIYHYIYIYIHIYYL